MPQKFYFENQDTGEWMIISALSSDHAWAVMLDGDRTLAARQASPWWLAEVR